MRNRFYKFLVMLVTVIAVGSATTMLNLSMQKKAAESNQSFRPYTMENQLQLGEETLAVASQTRGQWENVGDIAPQDMPKTEFSLPLGGVSDHTLLHDGDLSDKSMGSEALSETAPEDFYWETDNSGADQQPYREPTEERIQQPSGNEKLVYYSRLQDMERIYTARMNAVANDTLAVQQKTAQELLSTWDDELNAVYQKLRKSLSDEDFRRLRDEERAWIRNRDAAANQAASKENYSNSTQNLAYTRSLLQWTKDRVYELASMYYGE